MLCWRQKNLKKEQKQKGKHLDKWGNIKTKFGKYVRLYKVKWSDRKCTGENDWNGVFSVDTIIDEKFILKSIYGSLILVWNKKGRNTGVRLLKKINLSQTDSW